MEQTAKRRRRMSDFWELWRALSPRERWQRAYSKAKRRASAMSRGITPTYPERQRGEPAVFEAARACVAARNSKQERR